MLNNGLQVHDRIRCPECDAVGTIDGRETRTRDGRVETRRRTYECPECETRWLYFP